MLNVSSSQEACQLYALNTCQLYPLKQGQQPWYKLTVLMRGN